VDQQRPQKSVQNRVKHAPRKAQITGLRDEGGALDQLKHELPLPSGSGFSKEKG
jgi:hypothetical protein